MNAARIACVAVSLLISAVFGCSPNGRNINLDCGSTHPEMLARTVVDGAGGRCDRLGLGLGSHRAKLAHDGANRPRIAQAPPLAPMP